MKDSLLYVHVVARTLNLIFSPMSIKDHYERLNWLILEASRVSKFPSLSLAEIQLATLFFSLEAAFCIIRRVSFRNIKGVSPHANITGYCSFFLSFFFLVQYVREYLFHIPGFKFTLFKTEAVQIQATRLLSSFFFSFICERIEIFMLIQTKFVQTICLELFSYQIVIFPDTRIRSDSQKFLRIFIPLMLIFYSGLKSFFSFRRQSRKVQFGQKRVKFSTRYLLNS